MASERRYYAACTLGLEEVLARELEQLGAVAVEPTRGGARFRGEAVLGYSAALWLRTATRLQEEIASGDVESDAELYEFVGAIAWEHFVDVDRTIAVDASLRDACLTHSRYAAQRVKDGIVDRFRARTGRRPSVDPRGADLQLKLHLQGSRATLYRDLSGESLHKRGYRPLQVKSPLNEAIAAGLVLLSDWDRAGAMLDPMCGSATLLIEAAMIAGDRAPGLDRGFSFERWPDFDARSWRALTEEARQRAQDGAKRIPRLEGTDRHAGAIAIANRAVRAAGVAQHVRLRTCALRDLVPTASPSIVITNPPYGVRLADEHEGEGFLESAWRDLGEFLRGRCSGATAWILCGSPALSRHLRLRASRRVPIQNGPIDCRFLRYGLGPASAIA